MELPDKLEECLEAADSTEEGVAAFVKQFVADFPDARDTIVEAMGEGADETYDASDKFANPEYFSFSPVKEDNG
jgi:hypothetical protein